MERESAPHQAIDSYDLGELSDDPFGSPPPVSPDGAKRNAATAQNAEDEGDEDAPVAKKRKPTVKLDESKLLGENGIPSLRKRAKRLEIKGYGHEFSDAERLISFFQDWVKDLYPKAKFETVLDIIEKAGHKGRMTNERDKWIDDGKRREMAADGDEADGLTKAQEFTAAVAERPKSALENDANGVSHAEDSGGVPDLDDLDDLDDLFPSKPNRPEASGAPRQGSSAVHDEEPDGDAFDAMMAEHDALEGIARSGPAAPGNKDKAKENNDFGDEEDAMREMDGLW